MVLGPMVTDLTNPRRKWGQRVLPPSCLQDPSSGVSTDRAREAIDRHHSSTRGFGDETIPSSALIRTGAGDLLLVSFDRGWQVHQDEESAAELVAVCLEDLPPGVSQKRP